MPILIFAGCNQTKESMIKQTYHNLTSHYNAYFNANEKFKIVMNSLEKSIQDNYNEILPLYAYGTKDDANSYSSDLDAVIEKSSFAISKHEISRWTDDAYLLIGKTHYLRGEYDKAIENFQYITAEFKEGYPNEIVGKSSKKKSSKKKKKKKKKRKKRKKKKRRPTTGTVKSAAAKQAQEEDGDKVIYGALEHVPARNEALVWLVKSYTQQEKFKEAESILTYAKADRQMPASFNHDLQLAEAFMHLEKEAYGKAITPLKGAISDARKKDRARYNFILAQISEASEDYGLAMEHYRDVLDNQPNYEMAFYAKMRTAQVSRKAGKNSREIKELLRKMIKDRKNVDYFDQIYYELAEISISENDYNEAIENLNLSIRTSVSNNDQKALSYLRMAELYFEDEAYRNSKLYYDSALTLLAKENERYEGTYNRQKVLADLVDQLDVIQYEDSLQRLAGMSESERRKVIDRILAEKEKEKELAQAAQANEQGATMDDRSQTSSSKNAPSGFGGGKSSWYFYNPVAKSAGYNAFISQWGSRKLEDNWRRKDKSSFGIDDEEELAENEQTTNGQDDGGDASALEANIPLTPEALAASNKKVVDAYYRLGTIYKDDLGNSAKAIATFEKLNSRYPGHQLLLESYYNLYLLSKSTGNSTKANLYKNKILSEFPNSTIAKIISDPNYASKANKEKEELNAYYEETYSQFNAGNYDVVRQRHAQSKVMFASNAFEPKFDFLHAMAVGHQGNIEQLETELSLIVSKYPDDEVKDKAQEILNYISGTDSGKPKVKPKEPVVKTKSNEDKLASLNKNLNIKSKDDTKDQPVNPFGNPGDSKENPFSFEPSKDKDADQEVKQEEKSLEDLFAEAVQAAEEKKKKEKEQYEQEQKAQQEKEQQELEAQLQAQLELEQQQQEEEQAEEQELEPAVEQGDEVVQTPQTEQETSPQQPENPVEPGDEGAEDVESPQPPTLEQQAPEIPPAEESVVQVQEPLEEAISEAVATIEEPAQTEEEQPQEIAANTEVPVDESSEESANELSEESTDEPSVEENPFAAELAALEESETEESTESDIILYGISQQMPHYFVVSVPRSSPTSELQENFEKLTRAAFADQNIKTSSLPLGSTHRLIICKKFSSAGGANAYLKAAEKSTTIASNLEDIEHTMFVISILNYATLLNDKDLDKYLQFYSENY